jgi:hypothetical protein
MRKWIGLWIAQSEYRRLSPWGRGSEKPQQGFPGVAVAPSQGEGKPELRAPGDGKPRLTG